MHKEGIVEISMRLDQFLASHCGFSRAQGVKFIEAGLVRCNGTVVRTSSKRLKVGDRVEVSEKSPARKVGSPGSREKNEQRMAIPVLYEDSFCLVINKPIGITVHPNASTHEEQTLIEVLQDALNLPTLTLVHRLDKGTTGCLLIAKTPHVAEELQKQFRDRNVKKEYLAIVAGIPQEKEATIDASIGRSLVDRTRMSLFRTSGNRHALTHYRILQAGNTTSLLLCRIETGRTHQIRVHLRAIGHPILGDEKYGNEESRRLSKKFQIENPALHAWKLMFLSPAAATPVSMKAPIPISFQNSAHILNLSLPSTT